jgi:hypothetical protein
MSLVEAFTEMAKVVQEAAVNAREFNEVLGRVSKMGIPEPRPYYNSSSYDYCDTGCLTITDSTAGTSTINIDYLAGNGDGWQPAVLPAVVPEPEPEPEPTVFDWLDEQVEEVCALVR